MHAKKLERWCEDVRERVENMLPSSKSDVTQHLKTMQHTRKVHQKIGGSRDGVRLLEYITWSRGLESGTCMKLPCGFMRETYSDIHLEIIKVSLVTVKQAWI